MNILRSITISLIIVLMIGCKEKTSNLSDEDLAVIIADMHITENAISRHDISLRDSLRDLYIEKLVEIHDISKEEIKYEVELLNDDPKRQSEIYSIVIAKLQEIEKSIKKQNAEEKNKN